MKRFSKSKTWLIIAVAAVLFSVALIRQNTVILISALTIFFLTSVILFLIIGRYNKSVQKLYKLSNELLNDNSIPKHKEFKNDQTGTIGRNITELWMKLNSTREELLSERKKLIRHLNMLEEGIAVFSKEFKAITYNNHFIQYVSHISDRRLFAADDLLRISDFSPVIEFVKKNIRKSHSDLRLPSLELTIFKNGKYFSVKCTVFNDLSFEILISDVTKGAKRKLLKKQMTENIAHELKTPVSSIKGLLETILLSNPGKKVRLDFLQRAFAQTTRLANLIDDISMLTKIEEGGKLYEIEEINLNVLVNDILLELEPRLKENHVNTEIDIPDNLVIKGNQVLIYSLFRNLFDNVIEHAGKNILVRLENYMNDPDYNYFSFSDTGKGVPEEDLSRLFERFYRVNKGRDRKKGGTGLGLAIAKNAIKFHKGDISVKNRKNGGLEFLFTLSRTI